MIGPLFPAIGFHTGQLWSGIAVCHGEQAVNRPIQRGYRAHFTGALVHEVSGRGKPEMSPRRGVP